MVEKNTNDAFSLSESSSSELMQNYILKSSKRRLLLAGKIKLASKRLEIFYKNKFDQKTVLRDIAQIDLIHVLKTPANDLFLSYTDLNTNQDITINDKLHNLHLITNQENSPQLTNKAALSILAQKTQTHPSLFGSDFNQHQIEENKNKDNIKNNIIAMEKEKNEINEQRWKLRDKLLSTHADWLKTKAEAASFIIKNNVALALLPSLSLEFKDDPLLSKAISFQVDKENASKIHTIKLCNKEHNDLLCLKEDNEQGSNSLYLLTHLSAPIKFGFKKIALDNTSAKFNLISMNELKNTELEIKLYPRKIDDSLDMFTGKILFFKNNKEIYQGSITLTRDTKIKNKFPEPFPPTN